MSFCCVCDAEWGSTKTGEQKDLIVTALNCVLKVPQYLPQERRFDIRVLVSCRPAHDTNLLRSGSHVKLSFLLRLYYIAYGACTLGCHNKSLIMTR